MLKLIPDNKSGYRELLIGGEFTGSSGDKKKVPPSPAFMESRSKVARGLAAKVEDNDFRIDAIDVPFARILYGQPSKYMDMEDYRSRRQEIMQLSKELKNNPRADKPERYIGVRKLNNILKKLDKNLEALRNAKRRALDIEDYTQRMIRIQEIQDKERKIVMQFNKYYEQIRKD